MKWISCSLLWLLCLAASGQQASSTMVDSIRKAGVLTCGIDQSEAEYSTTDEHGSRVAFDQDLCKAVAIAILGSHPRIAVRGYPDNETAITALQHKEVDLVATVSDDVTHGTIAGIGLTRPVLFDGLGFMVLRSFGIAHAADLDKKKICFLDQTEAEINLHTWFALHRLSFIPFPFQEEGEMEAAFVTGNCTALSGDLTRLANARVEFGSRAREYMLLPETIALDPLAMAYRNDDPAFGTILGWTVDLLLSAEELGVSSKNVELMKSSSDPVIARLVGKSHELAGSFGLDERWRTNVLKEVGNFAEIFMRDLGDGSPLKMTRGENSLWINGGMMYAVPLK